MNNEKKAPVLTLEHLAPYLPYAFNVISKVTEYTYKVLGLSNDELMIAENAMFSGWYAISNFKPILRPISDLTKEIEHNEKKFVPIEWFEIGDDEAENWFTFDHGNINLINDLSNISIHGIYHDINFLPYAVVQKLIKWHFDVFGLIEKGLAIDMNSIEGKETKGNG
ncbi:MAG: hypothetical protein LBJ04_22505 [Sphingobacterium sp.]|nr:hypothetical protein [Sphingobacterium sp.]